MDAFILKSIAWHFIFFIAWVLIGYALIHIFWEYQLKNYGLSAMQGFIVFVFVYLHGGTIIMFYVPAFAGVAIAVYLILKNMKGIEII